MKTLDTKSQVSGPCRQILCTCCHTSVLGELSAVHVVLLGEDAWVLAPGFSWILVDFNLYPFTVITHNCE